MARRRRREDPEHNPPASPPRPKRPLLETLEQIAKGAIARRATPSAVPGNVKLTMTHIPRRIAEQFAARAVREAGTSRQ